MKMMKYKYILFDLDGTITDPVMGITNAYMYALEKFNIKVADRSELFKVIGPPLRQSFPEFYHLSDEDTELAVGYYREYYGGRGLEENDIMPGIPETLEKLKASGCKLYVATSKPEEYAVKILQNLELDGYFDYVAGASMDGSRDNKASVIEYLMEKIRIEDPQAAVREMVMVGDRSFDVEGAKAFGMDSIGVLFGYGSRQEFEQAGATYIVETADEILNI
jgi:phosphoglycolate phosphatase